MPNVPLPSWNLQHSLALIMLAAGLLAVWLVGRRVFHVQGPVFRTIWRIAVVGTIASCVLALLDAYRVLAVSEVLSAVRAAANHELFTVSTVSVTPITIFVFMALLTGTWWGSVLAGRGIERTLAHRAIGDPGTRASVARLIQYAIGVVGLAVAMQSVGIDLGALLTAGAVFAVGIGFAMQNIAQNFVSGVILLAERTISPGDIVVVDGQMVRIRSLGIRATIARTLDDEELIIPNSFLVQSNVKNLTLQDSTLRVRLPVGVRYGSDIERVFEALKQAAAGLPGRLPREPSVVLMGFVQNSVDFEVSIWIDDPWQLQPMRSNLARAVAQALNAAEVTLAFPQLDLRLDDGTREALLGARAQAPGAADLDPTA